MLQRAPEDALCPQHPTVPAAWICPRCGSFFCQACERRTRPDAQPMCPACWTLRLEQVGPPQAVEASTSLQTAALVVGGFAILPVPLLQLAALIIGILGLLLAKTPAQKKVRWRPIVGLCLMGLGIGIDVLLVGLAAMSSSN